MNNIDTIIFDLDGTILDTLEDLKDSVNYALSENGLAERTLEEIRSFVGNGIRNLIERSVPEGNAAEVTDKVFDMFKGYYKNHCKIKTKPYEGISEMLKELSECGYKMTIVSNKADNAVQELLKEFFYPAIETAYGERAGIPRKPEPEIVRLAMKEIGADPARTVYIGDSEVDFKTAEKANLGLIMVSWGFRDRQLLASLGAEHIADTTEELVEIIKKFKF